MKVVVFDNITKELVALVTSDNESICRDDVDVMVFGDNAEPIIETKGEKVYFVDNAILYNGR